MSVLTNLQNRLKRSKEIFNKIIFNPVNKKVIDRAPINPITKRIAVGVLRDPASVPRFGRDVLQGIGRQFAEQGQSIPGMETPVFKETPVSRVVAGEGDILSKQEQTKRATSFLTEVGLSPSLARNLSTVGVLGLTGLEMTDVIFPGKGALVKKVGKEGMEKLIKELGEEGIERAVKELGEDAIIKFAKGEGDAVVREFVERVAKEGPVRSIVDLAATDSVKLLGPGNFKPGIRKPEFTRIMGKDFTIDNFELPMIKSDAKRKAISNLRAELKEFGKQSESELRKQVKNTLQTKIDDFEEMFLGSKTATVESLQKEFGGTKTATSVLRLGPVEKFEGSWSRFMLRRQEDLNQFISKKLVDQRNYIRTSASAFRGLFGGLGTTKELSQARDLFNGSISKWNSDSAEILRNLEALVPDKAGKKKIQALLDPEISDLDVTLKDLSPAEREAYSMLRQGYDMVHDWNFSTKGINADIYTKYKGTYAARAYDVYDDMPLEVDKSFNSITKKMDLNIYKGRKEASEWMKEHNLNEPFYMFTKRLNQTGVNAAVKDYTDYVTRSGFSSDVAKEGFTKLSDSRAYGALAGKYIPNHVAQDFKGFFFTNKTANALFDFFKVYDKMGVRRARKALLTVYNPAVQVGNVLSDNVFAFHVGVDPLTLNKRVPWAVKEVKDNGNIYRFLLQNDVLKSDFASTELLRSISSIDSLNDEAAGGVLRQLRGTVTAADGKVKSAYAAVDDVYKIAAFKSLLDREVGPEEALRLVKDGFQNYKDVGKFYDVASKTPIVGNAFVKFQGDLVRIIKSAAVNRPLHLASYITSLYLFGEISSRLSGEAPADKETREERPFIPSIPGLGIPLVFQTPWGEVNVARYMSPYYAYTDVGGNGLFTAVNDVLPYDLRPGEVLYRQMKGEEKPSASPGTEFTRSLAQTIQDPVAGPFIQAILNADFRGKPIQDPKETKFQSSTATGGERVANTATFLRRQFQPQTVTEVENLVLALQDKPDIFDRDRSPLQAIARLFGIKVEEFGATKAEEQRRKSVEFAIKDIKSIGTSLRGIGRDLAKGDIDKKTYDKRREQLIKELGEATATLESLKGESSNDPEQDLLPGFKPQSF